MNDHRFSQVVGQESIRQKTYEEGDGVRAISHVHDGADDTFIAFLEVLNKISYLKIVKMHDGGLTDTWINKLGDGVELSSLEHVDVSIALRGKDITVLVIGRDSGCQPRPTPYMNYFIEVIGCATPLLDRLMIEFQTLLRVTG